MRYDFRMSREDLGIATIQLTEFPRPQTLDEIVGQTHVLGPQKPLGRALRAGILSHLLIYGPPGSGKTTFAQTASLYLRMQFVSMNASIHSIKDIRTNMEDLFARFERAGEKTLFFLDEIHHLNKSQQDVLLPYLEKKGLIFIAATSEPPSAELNRALLSRCQLVEFKPLSVQEIEGQLARWLVQICEDFFKISEPLEELAAVGCLPFLSELAHGDLRRGLSLLRTLLNGRTRRDFPLKKEDLDGLGAVQSVARFENEDLLSSLIKSLRGSDPDSALLYCFSLLKNQVDPLLILRRLIILASEDIGNAEPRALSLAVSTLQGYQAVGLPEGEILISQLVCFLAYCPKSNASYTARSAVVRLLQAHTEIEVPEALKAQGSTRYKYPHTYPKSWVFQSYWPINLPQSKFYEPLDRGFEKRMREYLDWLKS